MTWGHNDKRVFIATGNQIHVGWVSSHVASLQLLSRLTIRQTLSSADKVHLLPLPCRIQNLIGMLFTHTIKVSRQKSAEIRIEQFSKWVFFSPFPQSCVPTPSLLLDFVINPHPENIRLHCTMIRHGSDDGIGATYTLYLEHLGGFLPLLKGKKVSKLRPEFVIYDPTLTGNNTDQGNVMLRNFNLISVLAALSSDWVHLPTSHHVRRGVMPMDFTERDESASNSDVEGTSNVSDGTTTTAAAAATGEASRANSQQQQQHGSAGGGDQTPRTRRRRRQQQQQQQQGRR